MLPHSPPVPVSAVWSGPGIVQVTFDRPLRQLSLNRGNWNVYYAGLSYAIADAHVPVGPPTPIVQITVGASGPDPTPNSVAYSPPPFDVAASRTRLPAAAFTGLHLAP